MINKIEDVLKKYFHDLSDNSKNYISQAVDEIKAEIQFIKPMTNINTKTLEKDLDIRDALYCEFNKKKQPQFYFAKAKSCVYAIEADYDDVEDFKNTLLSAGYCVAYKNTYINKNRITNFHSGSHYRRVYFEDDPTESTSFYVEVSTECINYLKKEFDYELDLNMEKQHGKQIEKSLKKIHFM